MTEPTRADFQVSTGPEQLNAYVMPGGEEIWSDFISANPVRFHSASASTCAVQFILNDLTLHQCGDDPAYCYYRMRAEQLLGQIPADWHDLTGGLPAFPPPTSVECYQGKAAQIELATGQRITTSHQCPTSSEKCARYRDLVLTGTGIAWIQTGPSGNWFHPHQNGTVILGFPRVLDSLQMSRGLRIVRRGAHPTPLHRPEPTATQTNTIMPCQVGNYCQSRGKADVHLPHSQKLACLKCVAGEQGLAQWQVATHLNFRTPPAHWADKSCRSSTCSRHPAASDR